MKFCTCTPKIALKGSYDHVHGCDDSIHYYMKDLGQKAEAAYEKHWSK